MTTEREKHKRCPLCGGDLREETAILPFVVNDSVVVVKGVAAEVCRDCGEAFLSGRPRMLSPECCERLSAVAWSWPSSRCRRTSLLRRRPKRSEAALVSVRASPSRSWHGLSPARAPHPIARASRKAAVAARPPMPSVCQALRQGRMPVSRPLMYPNSRSASGVTRIETPRAVIR